MGSPFGPVLADIFMCHFEEKWVMKNINQATIHHRQLQKRERSGKEYGCFPFV